jgi:non-ribosomal peptide synthetase component F
LRAGARRGTGSGARRTTTITTPIQQRADRQSAPADLEVSMDDDRIDSRFAKVATRNAARTATSDAGGEATYLELEWLADEVARLLRSRTGPGRLVALRAGRNRYAPAGVLGILRSGAAYLPVDPDRPTAHQKLLLQDSGAELVVSDSELLPDETLVAKAGPYTLAARQTPAAPARLPEDTAYLTHTPGSTGVVSHAQVLALLDAAVPLLGTGPDDVWTLFHTLSLDFGLWELWGPLLHGGRLVVVDREATTDALGFARLLASREVTVLTQTPSAFGDLLTEAVTEKVRLPALRRVVLGGEEPLVPADVRRWWASDIAPDAQLITTYGSTEAALHVTYCPLTPWVLADTAAGRTPIGRPLPHLSVSLHDDDRAPAMVVSTARN